MSKATLVALAALLAAAPAFAAKSVTVEQLSREVASSGKKQDAKVAERLYDLELTQRLSAKELAGLEAALPGPESRRALVALADQSQFLDPPPDEIPNQPAPSIAEQRAIIAKSISYVEATLHQLPNLYAQRDTIRYEDTPAGLRNERTNTIIPYQPLHPVSRSIATVLYRDGQEIVQKQAAQQGTSTSAATGMMTFGEFGPIFPVVYGDLPKGNLRWSHWEQGEMSREAVFRFDVPKVASHYQVKFCCISGRIFQQFSAYHGELTVDPSTGVILRLTLIADLTKADPMTEAELMVRYGPVELGGKTYFCPVRSISVSRAPAEAIQTGNKMGDTGGILLVPQPNGELWAHDQIGRPLQTMLNETVFDSYHLFRADVQILTANNAGDESSPTTPANASSESAVPSRVAPSEQGSVTNENAASVPSSGNTAANAEGSNPGEAKSTTPPKLTTQLNATSTSLSTSPVVAPTASGAITSAKTEVSNSAAAKSAAPPPAASAAAPTTPSSAEMAGGVPAPFGQTPVPPPMPSGKAGFSLSLNARLVDVDVTAVDRKGRPITNLTKKDFVIYDDSRKQSLESFTHVNAAPSSPQSPATAQPVLYTNRPAVMDNAQSAGASAPESSTILLLDPTSLDFADLNNAREQILKFLERLPKTEPVGLYVRSGLGFHILAEETTDHAALSAALRQWMPTAPDLAAAQEAEMRNRQQYDTIGNNAAMASGDLAGLNGDMTMPGSGLPVADPKRMQEVGVDPARATFGVLVGVAAHLKAIPGHKNLVWVASDNVLEDWSQQTPGGNISNTRIGSAGLRAQEALNDAHVSIYPLDASQLETMATDASLQNNGVQLNASAASLDPTANEKVNMTGGRAQAEMQQDIQAIQPAVQQAAQATGGQAFPRAGNLVGELNSVIADGEAAYLLSFSPDTPPDGKYHHITVTVPDRRGIRLRYRAGYLYTKEPATQKARLQQAIWQPQEETGIGINARWGHASEGAAVSLQIAASDIHMVQQGDRWTDRLDIFLVQRDDTGTRAAVKEQTLALNLKPDTYEKVLREGIPFAEYVEHKQDFGTVRIIVVDENSGRMGSVTLPAAMQTANR